MVDLPTTEIIEPQSHNPAERGKWYVQTGRSQEIRNRSIPIVIQY